MNLYSKKQRWKIFLVLIAAVIVGTSLWYTGRVVNQIKDDEERKINQWASNVRGNIEQVNVQDSLLQQQRLAYELLTQKEKQEAKLWARAMEELGKDNMGYGDYSFFIEIIQGNENIPVILVDNKGAVSSARNLDFEASDLAPLHPGLNADSMYQDTLLKLAESWGEINPPIPLDYILNQKFLVYYRYSKQIDEFEKATTVLQAKSDSLFHVFNENLKTSIKLFRMVFVDANTGEVISSNLDVSVLNNEVELAEKIADMKSENQRIPVEIQGEVKGYIYYQNSDLVKQLSYYPYIQFGIIGLFLLVSYFLFSTFRKAEQNQVWVGMAKETAHQLGTPISSLIAWCEILKDKDVDDAIITEINKDIVRLETVTERFSKIGSGGELSADKVYPVVKHVFDYLEKRVSKKVTLEVKGDTDVMAMINVPLFEWVVENLSKNSVDAMAGGGQLTCIVTGKEKEVHIDFVDTGKGISTKRFKTVFEPGFTTKQRGWGLGLSLVKRIVEGYHKGKVFVLRSEPGKGTTFRVVLKQG